MNNVDKTIQFDIWNMFPIIKSCENNDLIDNIIKNKDYVINFYSNKIILDEYKLVLIMKYLLKLSREINYMESCKTAIISMVIYKLLFNNPSFTQKNPKFKKTIYEKLIEFKKGKNSFEQIKELNNNINPLDTMLELYNIYFSTYIFPECIFGRFKDIFDINYLSNYYSILYLHSMIIKNDNKVKFNFKVINSYDIETFNKINYSLTKLLKYNTNNNDNEVIVLAMYENFINNINYLINDNKLREIVISFLNEIITNNLSDYNKYKNYNYDKNPLLTINSLINYLLKK